ncbi:unnamed protein product [Hymenolepis diminuta]|uniref:Uncharacterized protein n=1 Tax=Hymenolepis diminuta TaxID=6216 RepID=A0A564Z1E9_HYMDI|nr:unnamed protein product [Hymenolepis diminuta]
MRMVLQPSFTEQFRVRNEHQRPLDAFIRTKEKNGQIFSPQNIIPDPDIKNDDDLSSRGFRGDTYSNFMVGNGYIKTSTRSYRKIPTLILQSELNNE